jgi:hypothetical protein
MIDSNPLYQSFLPEFMSDTSYFYRSFPVLPLHPSLSLSLLSSRFQRCAHVCSVGWVGFTVG